MFPISWERAVIHDFLINWSTNMKEVCSSSGKCYYLKKCPCQLDSNKTADFKGSSYKLAWKRTQVYFALMYNEEDDKRGKKKIPKDQR